MSECKHGNGYIFMGDCVVCELIRLENAITAHKERLSVVEKERDSLKEQVRKWHIISEDNCKEIGTLESKVTEVEKRADVADKVVEAARALGRAVGVFTPITIQTQSELFVGLRKTLAAYDALKTRTETP